MKRNSLTTLIDKAVWNDIFLRPSTAEDIATAKAATARAMAEELARYNAMSERERTEYDALTEGMMPRIPR